MQQSVDFTRREKRRKKTISALVAAVIIIVSGFIIRAKLQNRMADESFDYFDNPHDTELGAVM